MKLFILFSIFAINYCTSQTEVADSFEVIAFNEKIANSILKGDRNLDIDLYLTIDQLQLLMSKSAPEGANQMELENYLQSERENYDANLNQFSSWYTNNFKPLILVMGNCDSIEWNKCVIDSVAYSYEIIVPDGRDEKIPWPESKRFQLTEDKMISCSSVVFVSEEKKKYAIQIRSWYFQGDWKFYHNVQAPRIRRLN